MYTPVEVADAIFANAWVTALGSFEQFSASLAAQLNTPAMAALPDEKKQAISEQVYLKYIADSLYMNNVAIAMCLKHGVMPKEVLEMLEHQFAAFTLSAISGDRAYCVRAQDPNSPCDWIGLVRDCGPSGVCPKCNQRSATKFDLVKAPAAPFAHDGLSARGIILDP